jgi:type I restriction enzyme, S subunit
MNWKKGVLQDLVFFQRGFDITKAEQQPGEYPVISSSGITSYHSEAMVSGPGVIIGRKGTLGSVHYSEGDYWPHDTTLWSKDLT